MNAISRQSKKYLPYLILKIKLHQKHHQLILSLIPLASLYTFIMRDCLELIFQNFGIDIPKFNGSLADWLSFKDLFNSLILANPTLTSVEKLQYLKTGLIGSASYLLKNTTLTADNFQKGYINCVLRK